MLSYRIFGISVFQTGKRRVTIKMKLKYNLHPLRQFSPSKRAVLPSSTNLVIICIDEMNVAANRNALSRHDERKISVRLKKE